MPKDLDIWFAILFFVGCIALVNMPISKECRPLHSLIEWKCWAEYFN